MAYTYTPSLKPNTRIDVADILRGIAIAGIILIHFIEHMNFYRFPEPSSEFWAIVNDNVWRGTFFMQILDESLCLSEPDCHAGCRS